MTRSLLLASCTLLSGLTVTTAWAQQAPATAGNVAANPQAAPVADDHEIVVSGVRASLSSAIGIKRNSTQIVDSIVAEDIGKLPDNNVAEALQRVTGVQITRSQGEGSGIAIRGLSQVQQLVNGRNFFTTSGRTVALGDIPAALLAGVDVYKTSSADQIEGGIGGVVDIRLRRPFDFKGSEKSITAKGFYGDIAKRSIRASRPYGATVMIPASAKSACWSARPIRRAITVLSAMRPAPIRPAPICSTSTAMAFRTRAMPSPPSPMRARATPMAAASAGA
jgi:outer membrane receptor protein involved in Fe transport